MPSPIVSGYQQSVALSGRVDPQAIYRTLWEDDRIGRAVLELTPEESFRFVDSNLAIAHSRLFPTADISGRTLSDVLPAQQVQHYQYHCNSCVHTKKSVVFEVCAAAEVSSEVDLDLEQWWQIRLSPVKDETGRVYQMILTATDISSVKQTQAKLETAIQDARTVIDNIQEYVTIHEPDGKFVDVNQAFLDLHQVTREEALRSTLTEDLALPESPVHLLPGYWEQALRGEQVEFEWPVRRLCDNSRLDSEVTLKRVTLGGKDRLLACILDVTARKQAETEQNRLLEILDGTTDLVGIADAEGTCVYINRAGRRMLELPEAGPVELCINDVLCDRQKEMFANTVVPYAVKKGSWSGELTLVTKTGRDLPASQVVIAHKNVDGTLKHLSTVARDISELKAVEDKLRDREQFLDSIYSGTDIAIFSWDIDSSNRLICSGWNPACERATGLSVDKALGKTPAEVFGIDQGRTIAQKNIQCATQRCALCDEEEILIKGSSTWWTTKLHPILDETGKVYRVVGTTTNITELKLSTLKLQAYSESQTQQTKELTATLRELKRTQAQIIQSEKMSSLGQMVAGVAHEINNPVNFIHANIKPARTYVADLLEIIALYQQECSQPSAALLETLETLDFEFIQTDLIELLDSMKVGTDRIRNIVLSLRNFSRLDEAEVKAVNIHEGIDSTLVILAHKIKADGDRQSIEIIKSYQLSSPVECYPSQINQVVMNILANAIDALEQTDQPKLSISTKLQDSSAIISISDNGPGMSKAVQARIFDPFFTTKGIGKGTGMGLSISYQIVTEKHGGKLSVSSQPGEGTQFTISIPLSQQRLDTYDIP